MPDESDLSVWPGKVRADREPGRREGRITSMLLFYVLDIEFLGELCSRRGRSFPQVVL